MASGDSLTDQRVALRSAGNSGLPCAPIALKVISFTANKTRSDRNSRRSSASRDQPGYSLETFCWLKEKKKKKEETAAVTEVAIKSEANLYIREQSISREHVAWLFQDCS